MPVAKHNTAVIVRLEAWGLWRVRAWDSGQGYSAEAHHIRGKLPVPARATTPLDQQLDCIETDRAVADLPESQRLVVLAEYTQTGTRATRAAQLNITPRTYRERLQVAWRRLRPALAPH